MSKGSIIFQAIFCFCMVAYYCYLIRSRIRDRKKYAHLEKIMAGDEIVITEAVGIFNQVIYVKARCIENDVKNKTMLLRGKSSMGSFFSKAYKYDCANFKDFNLMQKVFEGIESEMEESEKNESKQLTLSEALLRSEELLADAQLFEDAAKVRDIKNKILKESNA